MKTVYIKKIILISIGIFSLILGILGIAIPLLPTTPLLILSSICFLNSSDKLYNWILDNKFFGKYIVGYTKYRAVSLQSKIVSLVILWIGIGSSAVFFVKNIWIRIALIIIAIAVTIHIILLKNMTDEMFNSFDKDKNTKS